MPRAKRSCICRPEEVDRLRVEKGYSFERLSAVSGVRERTLTRLYAQQAISLESISLVAEALGVSPQQIIDMPSRATPSDPSAQPQSVERPRLPPRFLYVTLGLFENPASRTDLTSEMHIVVDLYRRAEFYNVIERHKLSLRSLKQLGRIVPCNDLRPLDLIWTARALPQAADYEARCERFFARPYIKEMQFHSGALDEVQSDISSNRVDMRLELLNTGITRWFPGMTIADYRALDPAIVDLE